MKPLPIPPTQSQYWAFRGGLDQITPPLTMKPGYCRAAANFEIGKTGGLQRIAGYERFDGQAKPSDASFYVIDATMSGAWSTGDILTGATSGATGVIIAGVEDSYFVVTKVTGTFVDAETLNISGNPVAVAASAAVLSGASTPALSATYQNLAADEYRADIAAVPGEGDILGVWKYDGTVYAFRNAVGSATAVMWAESPAGWAAVSLGRYVAFTSGGVTEIAAGDTITGATSLATAVITKVVLLSGTWAGGTAAGVLHFASQTGTFQAENLNVGASLNLATIAGDSTSNSLAPSGRYEFVNHNFAGTANTTKMYGASGVHKGFEYDGTTFVFITTGMVSDAPQHVIAHKQHLFFSFDGSVQHSGIGTPHIWSVVTGASEIAVGDSVTGFLRPPGGTAAGALVIYTRNSANILYGNSAADWNLQIYNPDAGALEWTMQYVGMGIVLDDRGITTLETSQRFGNFTDAIISTLVEPFINSLRSTAIASCVVREKGQHRLFFSGGAALYATFINNKPAGMMQISLENPVACICSLEASSGEEEIFFGSTNGFVYQMEKGTSHDGEAIAATAQLAFNHFGNPRQLKTYRKAVIEVSGPSYCEFSLSYQLGYGVTDIPQGDTAVAVTANLSETLWDSFIWDAFFWDGQTLIPSQCELDGTAENLSLIFSSVSDEFESFVLNGAMVDFSNRRALR
jgi:hypothetical protein